jgi:hypothetical protein
LTWWNLAEQDVSVQLMVEFSTSNGDTERIIIVNTLSNVPENRAITFAVQPDALQLPFNTLFYSVQVVTADVPSNSGNFLVNTPLSSWRVFKVDASPRRNVRQLAYLNGYGDDSWRELRRCGDATRPFFQQH